MKTIFFSLMLFGISAIADVPTELRCTNKKNETLDWNFTVMQTPGKGLPGVIQGTVTKLRIKKSDGSFEEVQELFQDVESSKYFSEEGYSEITVSPSDTTGVDTLKVSLDGELWDALGNIDQNAKGKLYIDTTRVTLTYLNGEVYLSDFVCGMVLPK
jgi:hypothetical protein